MVSGKAAATGKAGGLDGKLAHVGGALARVTALGPYLFTLPAIGFVGYFLVYPAFQTFQLSFTEWNGVAEPVWVGVRNYIKLASDPYFVSSFLRTVLWAIAGLIGPLSLGMFLAVVTSRLPLGRLLKSAYYAPLIISSVTTGVIWTLVYTPADGLLTTLFQLIDPGNRGPRWLVDIPWNTISLMIAHTWQTTGSNMVLFLLGLSSLPPQAIEAAKIEGANEWQVFWNVTLPLLRPITVVAVGQSLVNTFKVFDIIWVMTQGGPYRSSETLAVTMYRESFVHFNMGYGAAVAMVLTLIVLVVSGPYLWSTLRRDMGYEGGNR